MSGSHNCPVCSGIIPDGNDIVESYPKEHTVLCAEVVRLVSSALNERARIVAWLYSEDARRYTEVGPLIAMAIREGRHQ